MGADTIRAIVPFPTTSRRPEDFMLCTISSWVEYDDGRNPTEPVTVPGRPQTEHVIVEFDVDRGSDACIYLQAQWDDEGDFILQRFDDQEFVPFVIVRDSSGMDIDNTTPNNQSTPPNTEAPDLATPVLSGPSQAHIARQRLAVGLALGVMVKGNIPGSALRQPGEKTNRGRAGQADEGTSTGWALPVATSWRTHRLASLLCDVQSVTGGNDELPIYQDALNSFSPSSEFSPVMASQDRCRAPSLFHLARSLGLRDDAGRGNQGYTFTAKGNIAGKNGTKGRDTGNVLVVQGRAAKFQDSSGIMGVVVILSASPISQSDDGDGALMDVKGVVWADCVRNKGGNKSSSPPRALTSCIVRTFESGFRVRTDDLFKNCPTPVVDAHAAPQFRNMSRDDVECTYIQAHATPFRNDSSLKPYLSCKESFLVAAVWRASNPGMNVLPINTLEDGTCNYLPGNYIISFAQTVVTAQIQQFKNAIAASESFI